MKKRGFEMSFAWIFAIIVGVIILFLAIYATTKTFRLGEYKISAETEKEIGVLLNPLEIGFETGKVTSFTLPVETRIYNVCKKEGTFGKQIISISGKSFGKWPQPTEGTSFKNKYIFSEEVIEGKKFYIFSKPFEFPFKIADLIYLIPESKKYCFISAPVEIENELLNLNQENLLTEENEECNNANVRVCFNGEDCDIIVSSDYIGDYVENLEKDERVYFEGDALMYAAVFSDKSVYECQLKRLMKRLEQLALLYNNKALFVSEKCPSDLNLLELSEYAAGFDSSLDDLDSIFSIVNEIKGKNEYAYCRLW